MRQTRADAAIRLRPERRIELEKVGRFGRTLRAVAQRGRIVPPAAEGMAPIAIGKQLGVSRPTIRKRRARCAESGDIQGRPHDFT